MNISTHIIRLAKGIALALAVGALVPPVGQGGTHPNVILRNDIAHFGDDSGLVAESPNAIFRNDIAHFGNDSGLSSPTTASSRSVSPAPVIVRVDGGFDWVSALVGAAGGLGLLLAVRAAAWLIRTPHRPGEALS